MNSHLRVRSYQDTPLAWRSASLLAITRLRKALYQCVSVVGKYTMTLSQQSIPITNSGFRPGQCILGDHHYRRDERDPVLP